MLLLILKILKSFAVIFVKIMYRKLVYKISNIGPNMSDQSDLFRADWPSLPEHLWLTIFSKCNALDLLVIKDVCLQWRRIANDFSLTSNLRIENAQGKIKSDSLKKLLSFACDNLTTLSINGLPPPPREHLTFIIGSPPKDPFWLYINNEVMTTLSVKCKRLRRLALSHINADLTYRSFPSELTHLWLTNYHSDCQKLFNSKTLDSSKFDSIVYLNLSHIEEFESPMCRSLNKFESLRFVYMEGLYRINDAGIAELNAQLISNLVVIDLEGTDISDQSFNYILNNGHCLRELYLGKTNIFGDFDLRESMAKNLKVLCLINTKVSSDILNGFLTNISSLVSLNCDLRLSKFINSSIILTKETKNFIETCHHYITDKRFDTS